METLIQLPLYTVPVVVATVFYFYPAVFYSFAAVTVVVLAFIKVQQRRRILKLSNHKSYLQKFNVIIIGAGFSGINSGIECTKRGIQYIIFEKSSHVGGTWYYNQYPGCACDLAAHMYCYSFESFDWTSKYPSQPEIQKYLEHCAAKYKVFPNIKFNTTVTSMIWDKQKSLWRVTTYDGTIHEANFIINGGGGLHVPSIPNIEGQDKFTGGSIHTSQMRSDTYSSANKTIAIVGTAASAIQLIPSIAKNAKKLYVFQRTPNWILDKRDYKYSNFVRKLFKYVPIICWLYRQILYWRNEYFLLLFFGKGSKMNATVRNLLSKEVIQMFGEEKAKYLIPDYELGCKRVLVSDKMEYFHALKQSNVELITDPIKALTRTGICTDKEEFQIDELIYSTGFKVGEVNCDISGVNNKKVDISEIWKACFWGVCFPDFPNYFMLLGPNTALGANSVVWIIECQVNFIMEVLEYVITNNLKEVEVKREKAEEWTQSLIPIFKKTVWTSSCKSWYKNEKGEVYAIYPSFTFQYWWGIMKASWNVPEFFKIG